MTTSKLSLFLISSMSRMNLFKVALLSMSLSVTQCIERHPQSLRGDRLPNLFLKNCVFPFVATAN